jgi:hypothetical protein
MGWLYSRFPLLIWRTSGKEACLKFCRISQDSDQIPRNTLEYLQMSRILGIPEMTRITCWAVISGYFMELRLNFIGISGASGCFHGAVLMHILFIFLYHCTIVVNMKYIGTNYNIIDIRNCCYHCCSALSVLSSSSYMVYQNRFCPRMVYWPRPRPWPDMVINLDLELDLDAAWYIDLDLATLHDISTSTLTSRSISTEPHMVRDLDLDLVSFQPDLAASLASTA